MVEDREAPFEERERSDRNKQDAGRVSEQNPQQQSQAESGNSRPERKIPLLQTPRGADVIETDREANSLGHSTILSILERQVARRAWVTFAHAH